MAAETRAARGMLNMRTFAVNKQPLRVARQLALRAAQHANQHIKL
jgi:hypothetical protein